MKKYLSFLFTIIYILAFSEGLLILFSKFSNISTLEKLKYANKFIINYENDPVFKQHKKNFSENIMGVNLQFNSMGFRGKEYPQDQKYKKIMSLGSSLVMGWGVREDETYIKILEKKLNENVFLEKFQTINAGIMHTNTVFHYNLFKKYFSQIQPDMLILGYFIDDAKELSKQKVPFVVKHSYLAALIYQIILSKSSENLDEYYLRINSKNSKNWKIVEENLVKIKEICDTNNIKLIIVILPDFSDFENKNLENLYKEIQNRLFNIKIDSLNTYKSLKEKFEDDPRKSWISRDDNHPNSEANKIIANEIFNFLKQKKYIGNIK